MLLQDSKRSQSRRHCSLSNVIESSTMLNTTLSFIWTWRHRSSISKNNNALQVQWLSFKKKWRNSWFMWPKLVTTKLFWVQGQVLLPSALPNYDPFLYVASGKLVGAVVNRSQTMKNVSSPLINVMVEPPRACYTRPTYSIHQTWHSMLFSVCHWKALISHSKAEDSNLHALVLIVA